MTAYKRGDIVLARDPESNLLRFKLRPALVVQADDLKTGIQQVVLAKITSNLGRAGHPSRVLIEMATPVGAASGLLHDSVVMTDNLATAVEKLVDRDLGRLPDMTAVDKSLRETLAL